MPALTDLLDQVSSSATARPVTSALDAPGKALAAATINLTLTTNWPTATKIHFVIYNKTAEGKKDITTQTDWEGTLSGSTVSNLTLTGGTDRVYVAGATVEMTPTSKWARDLYTWGIAEHGLTGIHALGSTATLTSTKVITSLNDTNGNELIKVTPTASAINEITVTNAATGNAPSISATGGDTNAGLNLVSKGTGEVQVNGTAFSGAWQSWTPTWTNLTIGNSTVVAKRKQIGKTVHCYFSVTFGSTSSFTSGAVPTLTLPVTSVALTASSPLGNARYQDTGTQNYFGVVRYASTTTVDLVAANSATANLTEAAIPFSTNTDDVWSGHFTYEAA